VLLSLAEAPRYLLLLSSFPRAFGDLMLYIVLPQSIYTASSAPGRADADHAERLRGGMPWR